MRIADLGSTQTDMQAVGKILPLTEFIKARKAGAAKIAEEAAAKGGVATLTAQHFRAKLPAYDQVMGLVQKNQDKKALLGALQHLYSTASRNALSSDGMSEFQRYTGVVEVFGEVMFYAQSPMEL
jgi:hypothetical protein